MPSQEYPPPSIQLRELLYAADEGILAALPLPDIRDSPYDTSLMSNTLDLPEGVEDVRTRIGTRLPDEYTVVGTFRFKQDPRDRFLRLTTESTGTLEEHLRPQDLSLELRNSYPAETLLQVGKLGLRRFVAAITISVWQYAEIVDIFALEQPFTGDPNTLMDNQQVLIEGTVEDYQQRYTDEGPPHLLIRQVDNTLTRVGVEPTAGRRARFGSTALGLDNLGELVPSQPLPGDIVQAASVYKTPRRYRVYSRIPENTVPSGLSIDSLHRLHLLQASTQRIRETLQLQEAVHEITGTGLYEGDIASLSISASRKWIGNFIAVGIEKATEGKPFVLPPLLRQLLRQSIIDKLPEGSDIETQLPLALTLKEDYDRVTYLEYFGREVLMMNSEELRTFALEVCKGERCVGGEQAISFLFTKFRNTQISGQMAELAVSTFYERTIAKASTDDLSNAEHVYAKALLIKALYALKDTASEDTVADHIIKICRDTLNPRAYFRELSNDALSALSASVMRCGIWRDAFNLESHLKNSSGPILDRLKDIQAPKPYDNKELVGVAFPTALDLYRQVMPELIEAINQSVAAPPKQGTYTSHRTFDNWGKYLQALLDQFG